MRVAATALFMGSLMSGCGLIIQGREQPLRISSAPVGASVSFDNQGLATPADLTIPRRASRSLIRIKKDGYYSVCQFLEWKSDPLLITLDSIPAAIPLLIDLSFHAFPGQNRDVNVALDPIPPGYVDVLPSDQEVLDAIKNRGVDLCNPPPEALPWIRLRSRFGNQTTKVIAMEGEPSRPYVTLGQVDAAARGTSWWTVNLWSVGGFGTFGFKSYQHKESHAGMNEFLKLKSLELFGDKVDAVVDIKYEDLPGNDVSGTGVAVHFTGEAAAGTPEGTPAARLAELKKLLATGAISRSEYEKKRQAILNGL
ncbi:MAG: SHOCT domain-containing protein [bacterium]